MSNVKYESQTYTEQGTPIFLEHHNHKLSPWVRAPATHQATAPSSVWQGTSFLLWGRQTWETRHTGLSAQAYQSQHFFHGTSTCPHCVLMPNAWVPQRSPSLHLWTPGRWLADTIESLKVTHWLTPGKHQGTIPNLPMNQDMHPWLTAKKLEIISKSKNRTIIKDSEIHS